jgi:hypothetical protein
MQQRTSPARVKVPEAARILGVSMDTVRRRIRSGALKARQKKTSSGHVWLVELPEEYAAAAASPAAVEALTLEALRREIAELRREVRELRDLLQARERALTRRVEAPGVTPSLPWLQRRASSS